MIETQQSSNFLGCEDDKIWTVATSSVEKVIGLFKEPHDWVYKNGKGATLLPHFVILFQEMLETEQRKAFVIQGIDNTGLITIRYDRTRIDADAFPDWTEPEAECEPMTRFRMDHGLVYSHVEWGNNIEQIAYRLFRAMTDVPGFLADLSKRSTRMETEEWKEELHDTQILPIDFPGEIIFETPGPRGTKISFAYEGLQQEDPRHKNDKGTVACNVDIGSYPGGQPTFPVQVVVNNVIVKTYYHP